MEVAVILALGLQDWLDAGIIIGILLLNAVVGWYQEKQAADVVASLKGDIAMKARVVRNGQEMDVLARELVPGDIVGLPYWFSCTVRIYANMSSLSSRKVMLLLLTLD
jgi:H+-transporting ATPase